MHCFQTANTRKHQNYKAKTPEPLLIKDSEALIREATTRFELKSPQKNRIERGLLGTLILVAPNLHQTARRESNSITVQKDKKIKEECTLQLVIEGTTIKVFVQ